MRMRAILLGRSPKVAGRVPASRWLRTKERPTNRRYPSRPRRRQTSFCRPFLHRGTASGRLTSVGKGRRQIPLGAVEDDATDGLVAVEALQLGDELVHQLIRERVELTRPVEQHDRDRGVALDYDE